MNWTCHFAERTGQMNRSAVRELLKVTSQPGMISFAGGLPAEELFPIERVKQAAEAVLREHPAAALQYGPTEGLTELRDWLADRYSLPNFALRRENVAIVSGAQQALDLIGRVFLNPGDRVVVENPTYLALLSAWRPLGVEFLPVPSDAEGLDVDQFEACLRFKPKLVYSIPNFQNPQGTTLSLARRIELARLLTAGQVPLVEDDPYGELRFEGDPLPDIFHFSPEMVIRVGTFSKVLMPGLRVGWVIAPEPVIDRLVRAKQAADLHTSSLCQALVWELVQSGFLDDHVKRLRAEYRRRRDAMLNALERHLGYQMADWTRPAGGMFLMLRLRGVLEARDLLSRALKRQVAFVPGEEFHLDGAGRNSIRLNFTHAPPSVIEVGIRRLAEAIEEAENESAASLFGTLR